MYDIVMFCGSLYALGLSKLLERELPIRIITIVLPPFCSAELEGALLGDRDLARRCTGFDEFTSHVQRGWSNEYTPCLGISVHFMKKIPSFVLEFFEKGVLNLHPGILPHGAGTWPESWAIINSQPAGATLHQMTVELDAGPIFVECVVEVACDDTADTLAIRIEDVGKELLLENLEGILSGKITARDQVGKVEIKRHKDLLMRERISLESTASMGELLRILRGLTATNWGRRPYFIDTVTGDAIFIELSLRRELGD